MAGKKVDNDKHEESKNESDDYDEETDPYWDAVEESDRMQLQQIHDKLKDKGEKYWKQL